jgi:hypothetical protein
MTGEHATAAAPPVAVAKLDAGTMRRLRIACERHAAGLRQLRRLPRLTRTPDRLHALRSAVSSLRGAWSAVSAGGAAPLVSLRRRIAPDFVRALDDQAGILLRRGSLPQAGNLIHEALAVVPEDARTLALAREVRAAGNVGLGVRVTTARSFASGPSAGRHVNTPDLRAAARR